MNVTRTIKPCFNRRALATQAMQAAAATRAQADLDQAGPICVYGLCDTLGIVVRFNNFNMEGMYQRGRPPRIHLSARRPLPRRAYNCAHELGHHVFGHGSSVDELREDAKAQSWEDPKEFLADTFAGFILMPIIWSATRLLGPGLDAGNRDFDTDLYHRLRVRRRLRDASNPPLGWREHLVARSRRRPASGYAQGPAHGHPRCVDARAPDCRRLPSHRAHIGCRGRDPASSAARRRSKRWRTRLRARPRNWTTVPGGETGSLPGKRR